MRKLAGGIALSVALALGCAACGGGPSQSTGSHHKTRARKVTAKRTPSSTTTTTGASSSTTTTTTTTTTTPGLAACTSAELSVTAGTYGGALGHAGGTILFKNVGTATCTLSGYPGVAALNSSGQQVAQAQRTRSGYLGGLRTASGPLPVVHLQPGQSASALVEGTDVPHGTETSCPTYAALLVTPPTAKTSVKIARQLPGCTPIQVHPVVAGTTGDGS